jgi:hypothetical protein
MEFASLSGCECMYVAITRGQVNGVGIEARESD